MTAKSSLLRHVAMTVGALVVGTLVVVAPSVEQRVAKASAVGLDDTFTTFNGSNYFSANDNDIFDVSGNITVSAWIRPTSLCATSECVIVSKETNYLFGIVNGSTDSYTCKWLDSELTIVHSNYNTFSTSINIGLN